tara:strand:+ start:1192 stop:1314 length:123 start_codon:yes stop_codon:yes gene_type:complete
MKKISSNIGNNQRSKPEDVIEIKKALKYLVYIGVILIHPI